MNEIFKYQKTGDWLSWIGQPLLYDGALCVERDSDSSMAHSVVRSLDLTTHITCQKENATSNNS